MAYPQTFPPLNLEQAHTPVLIYSSTKFPHTMNISDYSVESEDSLWELVHDYSVFYE